MGYGDEFRVERRTTGQLRPPGTHIRNSYKDHDDFHQGEEHHEATNPYQKHFTTTREHRKSHRPNRRIATGSPLPWQDPEEHTASSSRTKTRGSSGLRNNEYLGPDLGAFQTSGKHRNERHHQSNRSRDYIAPPRQHSPARSHRSSGSRASRSSYHDGLTPMGTDMGVDYYSNRSPYYHSTPEPQYHPDPPTPGRGFPEENDKWYEKVSRHRRHSPATSYYDCPSPRYQ